MKSVTKPFENEYRAVFSVIKYSAKRNLNYTTSHRKLLLLPSKKTSGNSGNIYRHVIN